MLITYIYHDHASTQQHLSLGTLTTALFAIIAPHYPRTEPSYKARDCTMAFFVARIDRFGFLIDTSLHSKLLFIRAESTGVRVVIVLLSLLLNEYM